MNNLFALITKDRTYYGPFGSRFAAEVKQIELMCDLVYAPGETAIVPAITDAEGRVFPDWLAWNEGSRRWQRYYVTQPGDDFTPAERVALDSGAAFAAREEWPAGWFIYCSLWREPLRTFRQQEAAGAHLKKLFEAAERLLVEEERVEQETI